MMKKLIEHKVLAAFATLAIHTCMASGCASPTPVPANPYAVPMTQVYPQATTGAVLPPASVLPANQGLPYGYPPGTDPAAMTVPVLPNGQIPSPPNVAVPQSGLPATYPAGVNSPNATQPGGLPQTIIVPQAAPQAGIPLNQLYQTKPLINIPW